MAIQGRRSFFKGAEGWGWQFKGADRFLRAQRGGDGDSRAQIVF